jgi:hypothetical protein
MSHYAKVVDGKVTQVIVAEAEFFDTFVDTSPGTWLQTSYNTHANQHPEGRPLRGNYAGIGYTYDQANDVFYTAQPYASWVLNQTTWSWDAPTPMPQDGKMYAWDEPTVAWKVIETPTTTV